MEHLKIISESAAKKTSSFWNGQKALTLSEQRNLGGDVIPKYEEVMIKGKASMGFIIKYGSVEIGRVLRYDLAWIRDNELLVFEHNMADRPKILKLKNIIREFIKSDYHDHYAIHGSPFERVMLSHLSTYGSFGTVDDELWNKLKEEYTKLKK